MTQEPSPILAIGQIAVELDGLESEAMGVQSGLDVKGRPYVYVESSEASTGPSENPESLHKKNHQWNNHQQAEQWALQLPQSEYSSDQRV